MLSQFFPAVAKPPIPPQSAPSFATLGLEDKKVSGTIFRPFPSKRFLAPFLRWHLFFALFFASAIRGSSHRNHSLAGNFHPLRSDTPMLRSR
jgi:hypothetical protein